MKDDLSTLSTEELSLFNSNYAIKEYVPVSLEGFTINHNIINHIRTTFMKVQGHSIEDHNISGQTLDIEKYLQYRLNKKFYPRENHDREFFNVSEDKTGMTVGILIDNGIINNLENMQQIRNCLASIFKGLSIVPNIKLVINTYTGGLESGEMNLITTEIKKIEDIGKITMPKNHVTGSGRSRYYSGRTRSVTGEIGTSPAFFAIDYMTRKLSKVDDKKALIVICEARPNSNDASGSLMSELLAQKLTYRSVTKAQANGINTFAITLTSSDLADKELKMMFKGHVANGHGSNLEKQLLEKIDGFIREVNK